MEVTFVNPGAEYMIQQIMQTENDSAFWSEPLYYFYPQLDKSYAKSLPFSERNSYIGHTLRSIYVELEDCINEKVALYSQHWQNCKGQITAALSDAFGVDCANLFCDLQCNVSMNPIQPRFLTERRFDVFYLNSEKGAIGTSIHEMMNLCATAMTIAKSMNRKFGRIFKNPNSKLMLDTKKVQSL